MNDHQMMSNDRIMNSTNIHDENNTSIDRTANGFSTIDLNAAGQDEIVDMHDSGNFTSTVVDANASKIAANGGGGGGGGGGSGYTSFGEPFVASTNSHLSTGGGGNTSPKHVNATSTSTTTTAATNGINDLTAKTVNTIETLKLWSKSAYKCTKQIISEKLGKSSRTIDAELEANIEQLRDTKKKYEQILNQTRIFNNHFYHCINAQKNIGDLFSEFAQKTSELQDEFNKNAETQKTLFKHGEKLIAALTFFISNMNTLCHKTMEDTLQTVKNYEAARLEYDAYRCDYDSLHSQHLDQTTASTPNSRKSLELKQQQLNDIEKNYLFHKEQYERLKDDVAIKLKFLDENRIKVMQKQLILFHNAIAAYFSGNKEALEGTIKQFSIKLTTNNETINTEYKKSFLESQQ